MAKPQGFRPMNNLSSSSIPPAGSLTVQRHGPNSGRDTQKQMAVAHIPSSRHDAIYESVGPEEERRGYRQIGKGAGRIRGRPARTSSENEEDILARPSPSVTPKRTNAAPKIPQSAVNMMEGSLRNEVPAKFSSVDKMVESDTYVPWALEHNKKIQRPRASLNAHTNQMAARPAASLVHTESMGLAGGRRISTRRSPHSGEAIEVENSQPISISSDRDFQYGDQMLSSAETMHAGQQLGKRRMQVKETLALALQRQAVRDDLQHAGIDGSVQPHDSQPPQRHGADQGNRILQRPRRPPESGEGGSSLWRADESTIHPLVYAVIGKQIVKGKGLVVMVDHAHHAMRISLQNKELCAPILIRKNCRIFHSRLDGIENATTVQIEISKRTEGENDDAQWYSIVCEGEKSFTRILSVLNEWDTGTPKPRSDSWLLENLRDHVPDEAVQYAFTESEAGSFIQRKHDRTDGQDGPAAKRLCGTKLSRRLHDASGSLRTSEAVEGSRASNIASRRSSRNQHESNTKSDLQVSDFGPHGPSSRTRRASGRRIIELDRASPERLPPEVPYSQLHGLGPRWKKPLTFPKEGKRKATVDFEDLIRLDEGEFLNDSLIQFYLRWLQDSMERDNPQAAKRVYWFNSYFYATLTTGTRGRMFTNFDSVKRWTKQVDLFEYDYVVVPINESAHWYVVILCNLQALIGSGTEISDQTEHQAAEFATRRGLLGDLGIKQSLQQSRSEDQDGHARDEEIEILGGSAFNSPNDAQSKVLLLENDDAPVSVDNHHKIDIRPDVTPPPEPKSITGGGFLENQLLLKSDDSAQSLMGKSVTKSDVALVKLDNDGDGPQIRRRSYERKRKVPVRLYDPSEPAIITLDSLGQTHPSAVRALKTYLVEEAEDKKGFAPFEDSQIKGMNARGIPQQQNFCDCGLYLLGYMDKFVENPTEFVTKLLRKEYDETRDWPKLNPSQMRHDLRTLLQNEHQNAQPNRRKKASLKLTDSSLTEATSFGSLVENRADNSHLVNEQRWNLPGTGQLNGKYEEAAGSAEVKEVDRSPSPSWNVSVSDGATFQYETSPKLSPKGWGFANSDEMILESQERLDAVSAAAAQEG